MPATCEQETEVRSMKIVVLICILCVCFCASRESEKAELLVAVSIPPLAEIVEEIGKDRVSVLIMVPPGASPHTYEPTPGQLRKISTANIFVKVGTSLEFELTWLDKLLVMNKHMKLCDASQAIVTLEHAHHHDGTYHEIDPHIWVSLHNAQQMAVNICSTLVLVDSAHRSDYTSHLEAYVIKLDSLDKEIAKLFMQKAKKEFLVYHPAWEYFAQDYGLKQIVIEAEGKEPTAQDLQYIVQYARKNGIKTIFASPQFNTLSAHTIARDIGGEVVLISPLERNYLKNMSAVARAIATALE
jgi:zinc transport system substrate-binding protein